jgi:hydroxymethylpyrimidine pyrophosphatase-like HAD family hydrolase
MKAQHGIRLFLADVDGALVTRDKVLTEGAKAAVRELREAGIALAIRSGRPPRGMRMLVEPLALETPMAGFNGGVFVNPDLSVIESHTLDPAAALQTVTLIGEQGLDVWVYTETEWLIRDPNAPHVAREAWTVKFDARVVPELRPSICRTL